MSLKPLFCLKLGFLLLLLLPLIAISQLLNVKKLQHEINKGLQKAWQASVRIVEYDSVWHHTGNAALLPKGWFSGVAVDAEGHVLSVAHAVVPNQKYLVLFPNGKRFEAIGLGRIAVMDAAMLQITEPGQWAFAPMGWSSSLKLFTPCLSLAYPGSLVNANTPSIRFGYIAATIPVENNVYKGLMRSTCLMEPGDSGGPLFDLMGRVIGLHSQIGEPLAENYEVPINVYRQYWDALLQAKNYKADSLVTLPVSIIEEILFKSSSTKNESLPAADLPPAQTFPADPLLNELSTLPELERLSTVPSMERAFLNWTKNTYTVSSSIPNKKKKASIVATLIDGSGLVPGLIKNQGYLLSKSSMVGNDPWLELADGSKRNLHIIYRDAASDLVLLSLPGLLNGGIKIKPKDTTPLKADDLGRLMLSPLPGGKGQVSVLGNTVQGVPYTIENKFLRLGKKDGKIKVLITDRGTSPLHAAKLQYNDELIAINGTIIRQPDDVAYELAQYHDGDSVTVNFIRKNQQMEQKIRLDVPVENQNLDLMGLLNEGAHIANFFPGGKSTRNVGFREVLVHDAALKPSACGGPLYDLKGRFYGINIARLSRTTSLTIPPAVIVRFVKEALAQGEKHNKNN